ncbi:MAG TPA: hypothetical protein ENN22_06450 [bacterium]|nr:hypothetical protein [bacterium]
MVKKSIIFKLYHHIAIFSSMLLGVIFIFSCVERDRLNPLDPKNPETGGRPQRLNIYSEYNRVYLSWRSVDNQDKIWFRIYRKQNAETEFDMLDQISGDSNQYVDTTVQYDIRYVYRLTFVGDDFESAPSDTVSITPGPTFIWAGDFYERTLVKLTHDCSHQIKRFPIAAYPWSIYLADNKNDFWITDALLNRLLVYDLRTSELRFITAFDKGRPIELKIDQQRDRIWVLDNKNNSVHTFNQRGSLLNSLHGFSKAEDLDVDRNDGVCWVTDSQRRKLFRIDFHFRMDSLALDLYSPTKIAINQRTRQIWLIDSNRLLKISDQGEIILSINSGLNAPLELAVDESNGNCWVIDWSQSDSRSGVIGFSDAGIPFVNISNFKFLNNIIVNPYDNGCIITDSGSGEIIRIDASGRIVGKLTNFNYPFGIVVDY